jgi:hypothetical protein
MHGSAFDDLLPFLCRARATKRLRLNTLSTIKIMPVNPDNLIDLMMLPPLFDL